LIETYIHINLSSTLTIPSSVIEPNSTSTFAVLHPARSVHPEANLVDRSAIEHLTGNLSEELSLLLFIVNLLTATFLQSFLNSAMPSEPPFYSTLRQSGPIACITPGAIQANKGYSPDLASKITDGLYHPAIEVGLHLLNGDLYSAHFLARKMQNDQYG